MLNLTLRKALIGAVAGIAIGTSIELLTSFFISTSYTPGTPEYLTQFSNENTAVLVERLCYMFLGAVHAAASQLFDSEKLSLTGATLIHFILVMSTLMSVATYLKWYSGPAAMVGFTLMALLIYIAIWIGMWWHIRRQIQHLNAHLSYK